MSWQNLSVGRVAARLQQEWWQRKARLVAGAPGCVEPEGLEVIRLDRLEAFREHLARHPQADRDRAAFESGLQPPLRRPFAVRGYCYACRRDASLLVDFQYASAVQGVWTPSWRERLLCPHCGLNNRMRAAIHLFDLLCRPAMVRTST